VNSNVFVLVKQVGYNSLVYGSLFFCEGMIGKYWSLKCAFPLPPHVGNSEEVPLGLIFCEVLLEIC
jgi:hypothetical protein